MISVRKLYESLVVFEKWIKDSASAEKVKE
jgi:hypothetical protein